MRRRTVLTGVAAAVAALTLLGACTRSGGGSAGGSNGVRGPQTSGPQVAAVGGSAYSADGSTGGGSGGTTDARLKAGAAPLDLTSPKAQIRIADLTVQVAKPSAVQAQADRAGQLAIDAGGEVFSDDRSTGESPSARLTLKVPPDELTPTLTKLAALGEEKARSSSTQDVTQQVADVNSRVKSAQDAVTAMQLLFDRATKLSDIITIENELNQRQADLESLLAQQRALSAQVSMATITLTLESPPVGVGGGKSDRSGFLGGLAAGWDNFAAAAGWIATALGAVLPFAVLVALLAGLGLLLWRRRPHPLVPPPGDAA